MTPSNKTTPRPEPAGPLAAALDARRKGIVAIPCRGKVPLVQWKPWQDEMPPLRTQMEWFRDCRVNVAIITTGMFLVDIDSPEFLDMVLEHCGETPYKVRTPRGGIHLGYRAREGVEVRNQVRIKGMPVDVRTNGGIAVIPPSRTEVGRYEHLGDGLVPVHELPVAAIGWTRERQRRRVNSVITADKAEVMVRRARAWLACVEGAVSGQRGHDRTFRVACKLLRPAPRGFGLTYEQAWPLIKEWSECGCEPPWSDRELEHKLTDALKKV